jgi:hypothetical protein
MATRAEEEVPITLATMPNYKIGQAGIALSLLS